MADGGLIFGEMLANPIIGTLGDRRGHRLVLFLGALTAFVSCALAGWMTAIPVWFLIFATAGMAYAVGWTTSIALSLQFGNASEQAVYIGMSNTLVAPATLAAPFLAGWCIEAFSYPVMFRASALIFLLATALSFGLMRARTDPRR